MNEARAIELCIRHRDPAGFEYLVRKYRREAYGHALALVANHDDAAEVCQESFASAFTSLPRLTELTAFYPWFYRILRNRCLNLLRRKRTETEHAHEIMDVDSRSSPSSEAMVSRVQSAEAIRSSLAALKFEFREILTLKYQRDHDYAELSELLGIPRGTVMSRLYHARKAFHAAYLERVDGERPHEGEDSNG